MSNDKIDATFLPAPAEPDPLTAETWPSALREPTTQLPVWVSSAHRHGAARDNPGFGAAGMHTWEPEGSERSVWIVPVIAAIIIAATLAALGFGVQRMNWLPAAVPLIGKDSGVAACELIAGGGALGDRQDISAEMTEEQYRQARKPFADSRYPAIRDNGTRIIDLAWQVQQAGDGGELAGALMFMTALGDAYAGLAGGCAEHGYTIPALAGS